MSFTRRIGLYLAAIAVALMAGLGYVFGADAGEDAKDARAAAVAAKTATAAVNAAVADYIAKSHDRTCAFFRIIARDTPPDVAERNSLVEQYRDLKCSEGLPPYHETEPERRLRLAKAASPTGRPSPANLDRPPNHAPAPRPAPSPAATRKPHPSAHPSPKPAPSPSPTCKPLPVLNRCPPIGRAGAAPAPTPTPIRVVAGLLSGLVVSVAFGAAARP